MLVCSGSALGADLGPQAGAEIRQATGTLSLAPLFVTHDDQRDGVARIGAFDVALAHGELDAQRAARRVLVDRSLLAAARDVVLDSAVARVRFNLFEGVDLNVVFERTADTHFGYSLSGRIEGDPLGSVTLVVNGDLVAAVVHSKAGAFVIGSRNGFVHTVEEMVDDLPIGDDQPLDLPKLQVGGAARAATDTVSDDGAEIDLLVLFTNAALRVEGSLAGMQAAIDLAVAYANDAFRTSGVNLRMNLVAAALVGYREFDDPGIGGLHRQSSDLGRLQDTTDPHLAEAHELRDWYAADLVHLVVRQDGGGAAINSLQTAASDPSAWGFGVSNSVRSGWALVHAAGRHMGVRPDRYVDRLPRPGYPAYAHGYVNQRALEPGATEASRWRTIMSSYGQCNDQRLACRWLPRYSNAHQRYPPEGGDPLGVPGDTATDAVDGPANAARRMNETSHLVAAYRQSATRCDYRLSASRVELPWTGGTFSLAAETAPDCQWSVRTHDEFLSVASEADGVGAGTVSYRVEPNAGPARVGYVLVAGEMLSVFQSGGREPASVCDRAPPVHEAIVAATGKACGEVSGFDLLEVVDLDLAHRGITALDDRDFSGLRYLGHLDLTGNPVQVVPPDAFSDLLNLTELSLDRTGLASVPVAIRGMRTLTRLSLSGNAFTTLRGDAFAGLSRLRRLNLSASDLAALPAGVLADLKGLRYLYLGRNQLTDIRKETLSGPELMAGLDLAGNPLRELRVDVFTNLQRILDLNLSDTLLETIAPRTFAIEYLSGLNLADNRIADLSGVEFPAEGVGTLFLRNNALRGLPAGMFERFRSHIGGRDNLNVDLTGNPGTPFPIHLSIARIDAEPTTPGAATVVVRVREAAPWTMTVRVTATGGASFARDVTVPIGRLQSDPFAVADNGIALLRFGPPPPVPGTYKGMEVALSEPLRLFPFKDLDLKIRGLSFRLDLAAIFDTAEAGTLFTAVSSRPGVAAVAIVEGTLIVEPLSEGRVTVTLTSRRPSGATVEHRFGVTVADRDGTLESANLMPVGRPLAGTLLDEFDVDVYRLDLPGDATVEVRTSGPTDTQGLLLDSAGTFLASDDNSGPGGRNFRILQALPAGIHYVAVSGAGGDYAVGARLSGGFDQGDTEARSALLTLFASEALRRVSPSMLLGTAGRISSSADVDVFRLDVPRDRTDVNVRSAGGTALHARLVDSSLTQLASDDRGGDIRIATQLDAGVHYLLIGGHETGNYRVLAWGDGVNCPADPVGDVGDSLESSVLLPIGGAPRAGTLADGADVDVFRMDLTGRASIEVRSSGPTDTRGELFDASGASVASDEDSGPGGHNFRIGEELSAGVYYVAVSGSVGSYAVSARLTGNRDQGETAAAAALLPLFTERDLAPVSPRMLLGTAGRIWPTSTDVDIFRLDVPDDGTRVTVRTAGGTALRGRLVDDTLVEVAADRAGENVRLEAELDAGIHYLTIGGHTTGNYRVLASTDSRAEACPR